MSPTDAGSPSARKRRGRRPTQLILRLSSVEPGAPAETLAAIVIKPLARQAVDARHAVEETGNNHRRGPLLLRQLHQSGCHDAGVAPIIVFEYRNKAEFGGPAPATRLL